MFISNINDSTSNSTRTRFYSIWEPPICLTVRLAKLTVDKVLTAPCSTSVLYPKSGGNLHCFTALTPCAMLDILAPPYAEAAGRKCSYYHDYPYTTFCKFFHYLNNIYIYSFFIWALIFWDFLCCFPARGNGNEIDMGKEEYAWLAEIGTPDDLYMRSGRYMGPAILP